MCWIAIVCIKRVRFFCPLLLSGNYFCLLGTISLIENAFIIILFPVPISAWHWRWAQIPSWPTECELENFLIVGEYEAFSFYLKDCHVNLSPETIVAICYPEGKKSPKEQLTHISDRVERIMGNKHDALIKPYLKFILLLDFSVCQKSLLFIL